MIVTVTIADLSADEQSGVAGKLADFNARITDGTAPAASVEEIYAGQIEADITALGVGVTEERIVARRALAEVLDQLSTGDQQALVSDLIQRAKAAGVDTSAIETQ